MSSLLLQIPSTEVLSVGGGMGGVTSEVSLCRVGRKVKQKAMWGED